MNQRRIVIGDVHGHYQTLVKLLEAIAPESDAQVYFLGDLIDRGPESAQVVELAIENNYHCLRGNHEEMLLMAIGKGNFEEDIFLAWLKAGGEATISSYKQNIPLTHLDWLETLPLYLDLGDVFLVHAGLDPDFPLQEQSSAQFCWIRNKFHNSIKPYFQNKLIITGHTMTFTFPGAKAGQLVRGKGWLDIDTGLYHPQGGWLTAVDLSNHQVYQVNFDSTQMRQVPLEEVTFCLNVDS